MISAEMCLLFTLAGLVAGSTMGMVTWRLPIMLDQQSAPAKLDLWLPASHCCHCRQPLRWYDNIPLLSWIWLRGKCRYCKTAIAVRYPLSELLCALAALFCYLYHPEAIALTIALFLYFWFTLALCIIDLRHLLLPDKLTLPLLWCGLLFNSYTGFISCEEAITGAAAGYASLWLLNACVRLLWRKEGIGYGDLKLFAAVGAWTGWQSLPPVIYIAAMMSLFYGLLMILRTRRRISVIPFGPGLAVSGWGYFWWMASL